MEERGVELERRETNDPDEVLYWLFDGVTFSIAAKFELRNRKANEDTRRLLFSKQEALLNEISVCWGESKKEEHRRILTLHPLTDSLG